MMILMHLILVDIIVRFRSGTSIHTTNAPTRDDRNWTEMRQDHHWSRNGYMHWHMHRDWNWNLRSSGKDMDALKGFAVIFPVPIFRACILFTHAFRSFGSPSGYRELPIIGGKFVHVQEIFGNITSFWPPCRDAGGDEPGFQLFPRHDERRRQWASRNKPGRLRCAGGPRLYSTCGIATELEGTCSAKAEKHAECFGNTTEKQKMYARSYEVIEVSKSIEMGPSSC